jgi:hypothetical protein
MRILSISPPQGDREVARASIEFDGGVRLYDLRITRADNGHRVYARSATFAPATADAISNAVLKKMGRVPNDCAS